MILIGDIIEGLESQDWRCIGGGTHIAWFTKEGNTIKVIWTTNEKGEADQLIKICYSAPAEDKEQGTVGENKQKNT